MTAARVVVRECCREKFGEEGVRDWMRCGCLELGCVRVGEEGDGNEDCASG